jgi:cell division protein FtsW (lipid II flippase)
MRATFAYSVARILLFVVALGLLYLAGARGLLLAGLALVVSGIVSFIVLSRLRDRMSGAITSRIGRFRDRLDEGSRAEDDDGSPAGQPASAGPDVHP